MVIEMGTHEKVASKQRRVERTADVFMTMRTWVAVPAVSCVVIEHSSDPVAGSVVTPF